MDDRVFITYNIHNISYPPLTSQTVSNITETLILTFQTYTIRLPFPPLFPMFLTFWTCTNSPNFSSPFLVTHLLSLHHILHSTLHLKLLRGFLLAHFHLVISTSGHTSTNAAEHNISDKVDDGHNCIIAFKVNANVKARSADCKALKAVVASDKTHIILI